MGYTPEVFVLSVWIQILCCFNTCVLHHSNVVSKGLHLPEKRESS